MYSLIPWHLRQLRAQPVDHLRGGNLALVERLQIDLDAAAVQRGVRPIRADERRNAVHRRIGQQHLRQLLLLLASSAANEVVAAACEMPWMIPVSCVGKKPFGMMM